MDDYSFVADAGNTAADSLTSTGQHLRVSLEHAAPPASSFLRYNSVATAHGDEDNISSSAEVLAAHGDSVLFRIMRWTRRANISRDNFVYRAGAVGRPALLSLLPTGDISDEHGRERDINHRHNRSERIHILRETTGLLRRSDDELLVVDLGFGNDCCLNVIRLGSPEWETRLAAPPIVVNDDDGQRGGEILPKKWGWPDSVIPVGDRFLCWVKYSSGFLLCDMADPNLVLRSIPLPVLPRHRRNNYSWYSDYDDYDEDDDNEMQRCRNMCAAGVSSVRFVSIDPRCCCGAPGRGTCLSSRFAFTVTTWTMSLSTDDQTTWVKDDVMDCEELWALPGYESLPRVTPDNPVVSPENPDVVCFKVSDHLLIGGNNAKVWMFEVDTRKKALLSILQCPVDPGEHLPAKFYYNC